ncbi:hypothetical protein O181_056113 [Austropuccinia psidii MF-1]|uniref:Beta-mannosidase A n=1 Tax=Austropuccinia psidii MF-1 TaxID=1389203 RepID=A0A9Q3HT48_9BASI|nr:hypothetical protein [Austropuccinia psidii MF-1]
METIRVIDVPALVLFISNASSYTNRSINLSTPFLNQPHLALIDAGTIDEPNIGLNEGTLCWVGEEEAWTWETTFQIGSHPHWTGVNIFYLAFKGLNTFCDIKLGGHCIGSTDNAFCSWVFDITETFLAAHTHSSISLSLRFPLAAAITSCLAHEPGNIWFPGREANHAPTLELYDYNYRNWARKKQSDFGWDWGPAYLPCGLLQPAYLIGLSGEKEETKKSALSLSQNIPDFTPRPGEKTTRISLQPFESGPSSTTGQGISAHLEQEKNQLTLQRRRGKPRANQLNTPPAYFWIHRTVIDIHKKGNLLAILISHVFHSSDWKSFLPGQCNNLHPNQNEPWILNITLPITSACSLHHPTLTLLAILVGTFVHLEPKTLSITKPADYINLGPEHFLTAQYTTDHQRVELWYPATLGNPKLYDLELTLGFNFNDQKKNSSQSTWYEHVGF